MEDIPKGEQSVLEFQVVTGGKLDIDVELVDSEDNVVYEVCEEMIRPSSK